MTVKVIVKQDYQEMSCAAAHVVEKKITENPQAVLGLATGSTPLATYKEMVKGYKEGEFSYRNIKTLNLDEYVGLDKKHAQSYHRFMCEHLFDHIDIDLDNTHIPQGDAPDIEQECQRYEGLIDQIGPPDLQILGIGRNGHIGFNEPGTPFDSTTHVVTLTESTRKANARFFSSLEAVPTHSITMGIRSILKSKQILLLASGEEKAPAIDRLLNGEVEEDFPASALKNHPDVTLIVDEKAYQKTVK
ncbi:glucosamine-6-phosphate deaminase [Thalassobacillus sp. B23F22_16]|uniref:glucosamine-6-phosphate deaminase n=1 Tax=Thalassobacillus sp. B23F22_16 TaxID=3459513 RepID=UPI00373F1A21